MKKIKKIALPMQKKKIITFPVQKIKRNIKIWYFGGKKDLKTQKLCQFYRKSPKGDFTPLPLKTQNPAKSNCP